MCSQPPEQVFHTGVEGCGPRPGYPLGECRLHENNSLIERNDHVKETIKVGALGKGKVILTPKWSIY